MYFLSVPVFDKGLYTVVIECVHNPVIKCPIQPYYHTNVNEHKLVGFFFPQSQAFFAQDHKNVYKMLYFVQDTATKKQNLSKSKFFINCCVNKRQIFLYISI